MRLWCGAICLIALFVSFSDQESNQERGASKQLAPGVPYTQSHPDLIVAQASRHTTLLSSAPCNNPAVFYQGVLWRSAEPCVAWRRHIYPKSPKVSGDLFCRPRAATLQWPCELSRGRR